MGSACQINLLTIAISIQWCSKIILKLQHQTHLHTHASSCAFSVMILVLILACNPNNALDTFAIIADIFCSPLKSQIAFSSPSFFSLLRPVQCIPTPFCESNPLSRRCKANLQLPNPSKPFLPNHSHHFHHYKKPPKPKVWCQQPDQIYALGCNHADWP